MRRRILGSACTSFSQQVVALVTTLIGFGLLRKRLNYLGKPVISETILMIEYLCFAFHCLGWYA